LADYLGVLQGGCSQFPLDLLRGAAVDLDKPQPVDLAMRNFARLVSELDELLSR
jgi:oligoendopeptidase F